MKKIFISIIAMLLPLIASADYSGKCGVNVNYSYKSSTHTLTITGSGNMWDLDDESYYPWNSYRSDIQYLYIESGVTSIGGHAFIYCNNLLEVTIPSSVYSIGIYAFRSCTSLTKFTSNIKNPSVISDSNIFDFLPSTAKLIVPIGTKGKYTSASAWSEFKDIVESDTDSGKCGENLTYYYSRTTHTLTISGTGNMWNLDDESYYPWHLYRGEIQHVVINSDVTSISSYAFIYCNNLLDVTIPGTVTSIGMYAFMGCTSLTTITSGIKKPYTIADDVFSLVPTTAKLIVPIGTKKKYEITSSWDRFTNIVEPDSESGICGGSVKYSYDRATHTLTIYGSGNMPYWDDESYCPWNPFRGEIQHVVIGSGVTNIGSYSFYECTSLVSAIIPSTVSSISLYAFRGCSSLATILSEMTNPCNIDDETIWGVPTTAILFVPKGTKSLYESKEGWSRFTIMESEFEVEGITYKRGVDDNVSVVAGEEKYTGSIVIPSQVTYEAKTYNVTSIGITAFKDCSGLASVYLPEGLKTLGSMLFSGCTSLTCLNIPNSVTQIETGFTSGSGLDRMVIGTGIQKVTQLALGKKMTALAVLATTPPDFGTDQFTVDYIYVPKGCVTAYKDAWSGPITDILELVKGDVNLDGEVTEDDVDALADYILGKAPGCFFKHLADLNGDGKIDATDIVIVNNIINPK